MFLMSTNTLMVTLGRNSPSYWLPVTPENSGISDIDRTLLYVLIAAEIPTNVRQSDLPRTIYAFPFQKTSDQYVSETLRLLIYIKKRAQHACPHSGRRGLFAFFGYPDDVYRCLPIVKDPVTFWILNMHRMIANDQKTEI